MRRRLPRKGSKHENEFPINKLKKKRKEKRGIEKWAGALEVHTSQDIHITHFLHSLTDKVHSFCVCRALSTLIAYDYFLVCLCATGWQWASERTTIRISAHKIEERKKKKDNEKIRKIYVFTRF